MPDDRPRRPVCLSPRLAAVLAAAACLLPTAGASGQPDRFRFSEGFSSEQGRNQWSYLEWDGSSYRPMRWDPDIDRWRGQGEFCQIWRGGLHPDDTEAVIAWQAPRAGTVHIRGMIDRADAPGDGTRARVVKNGSPIWPSDGEQVVYPVFAVQHSLLVEVEAGDRIGFHLGRGDSTDFDSTRWDPEIRFDATPGYLTDEARFVVLPQDLARLGIRTLDSPLSVVGHLPDGRLVWSHSLGIKSEPGAAVHHRFAGTLEQPAGDLLAEKREAQFFVANPSGADGQWWLTNVYRHVDGSMLGFIHVEESGANRRKFRLGLAHSTDSGSSWTYLGHIIQQQGDPDNLNIMGTPYLVIDGHFYAYYQDAAGGCVARAPVAAVMAAAAQGRLTPWQKYFDGSFSEPGWGGRASSIGTPSELHSDAAYSTATGHYLLTGYEHGPGRGVWIASSVDGIHWAVDWLQRSRPGNPSLSPYITIVADDGTDNARVGRRFFAYWAYNPAWDETANLGLQFLVRQEVTLVDPQAFGTQD